MLRRLRQALAIPPSRASRWALAIAAGALLAGAAPAAAAPYVPIAGYRAPGTPARYNRVFVTKTGPASARRVLVLVPGYLGGAGDFTLVARELVRRVPGLQVWALDRRSNAFEDTSRFRPGTSLQAANDYYLGLHHRQVDGARDAPFTRGWGLKVALEDLRRVVLAARAGGRRQVILGGHSLGASTTLAYATWDFAGHPGYRDLTGLVLIDGGLLGTFAHPGLAAIRSRLADIRRGDPFESLLAGLPPWAAGVFVEIGSMYARLAPGTASPLQDSPLLPAYLRPPVRVTNEGLLGYDLDSSTSPPVLSLVHFRAGSLAPSGDPRGWRDGEVTPIQNVARTFWQEPGNGVEWYFPKRLRLDVDGDSDLRPGPITRLLGLRPFHTAQVDLPLYAIQTDLTGGRVLAGARAFVRRSRVPRATLVDWSRQSSHLDPLLAAPPRNRFLATVVPFLRGLG
jgi:hypothetical protein